MTPIDLTLRVGRLPAASTPVGGELSAEQVDGNFTALKTAAEQLDAEKLSADAAAPVTLRATEVTATDDVILLRGGVPYLVAATVLASYFGSAPAATAPAALTAGQWTATAGTTSVVINITALPSDGGSAITALQYRIGTGAAVALTGTGTGSRTISGLTADVAIDLQVRAVNAVGAGDWSDIKTRTPTASVGGGGAAYIGQSSATGLTNVTATAPSGLLPEHTQVAVCMVPNASLLPMTAPAGWTLLASHGGGSDDASAMAVFTAPGTVSAYAFSGATLTDVALVAISGTIRTQALIARYWGFEGQVHTNQAVTAGAGDLILAIGYQRDGNPTEPVAPQDGYTRQYITPGTTPPRLSVVTLADAPAGTTGTIASGAGFNDWSVRYFLTLAVQA